MRERSGVKRRKVRGKQTNTQFGRQRLTEVFGWMCSVPPSAQNFFDGVPAVGLAFFVPSLLSSPPVFQPPASPALTQ
jgi:hypothetical protein